MLLNMAVNMGWNFLNTTIETAKFVSNLLILRRSSIGMLIMSAHFLLLPIKCIRLKEIKIKSNLGTRDDVLQTDTVCIVNSGI